MKYLAIVLASLCLSLQAFSQQQTLPVLQTFYGRSNDGDNLVPYFQHSFQYDKDGRARVHKNYKWIEEEKRWAPGYSVESDYDDLGNLILETTTSWYTLTGTLGDTIEYTHTFTRTFDAQNRLIEYRSFYEFPRSGYTSGDRFIYTYDQNGCNSEEKFQHFINGTLNDERVTAYVLDEQCHPQVIRSYPTAITEGPHRATVYTYENNREVARHVYDVDPDTTLTEENFFEYDQSGHLVLDQRTGLTRTSYEYDDAGNLIRQWYDLWDNETMAWERSSEYYQTFDSDNNLLTRDRYFGLKPTGAWQYIQFESYEYNDEGKLLQVHYRSVYSTGPVSENSFVVKHSYRCDGLETETTNTITTGDNPGLASRTTTAYNHPAGCDNARISPIVMAPNPTSGLLRLLLPEVPDAVTIHMISSSGQVAAVITTDKGINPVELDVSELAAGLYIIQVMSEGFVESDRFVKN